MRLGKEIGIDLGTAHTRIWTGGRVILNEPTVIAIDHRNKSVVGVGRAAEEMIGRAPETIDLVRPLKDGRLDHYELAGVLLTHFLGGPSRWRSLFKPKMMVGLPPQATKVQEMAIQDALQRAGAGQVRFISGAVATAVGAGIDATAPGGWLLIDVGGGSSDISLISMGGVVEEKWVPVGGLGMDEAIATLIRRKYNVAIGERTAEAIKVSLGTALPLPQAERVATFRGLNTASGLPVQLSVRSSDAHAALHEALTMTMVAVKQVLEEAPPEISSDLRDNGILLAGGGSMLSGLDRLLAQETGLPVRVVDEPGECLVRGIGMIMGDSSLRRRLQARAAA